MGSTVSCTAERKQHFGCIRLLQRWCKQRSSGTAKSGILGSNVSNSPISNAILKLFAENRILTNSFPTVTCMLRMYFSVPCSTCQAEQTFGTLRRIKKYLCATMNKRTST